MEDKNTRELVLQYLTEDIVNIDVNSILDLKHYRKSPNLGVEATKPKLQLITPEGQIYFKFNLTANEICAELLAYQLANLLNIKVAKTALAWYKDTVGIASWSIGEYSEPDDSKSYSVLDYLHFKGFFEMCLFDYLIMNEDRHAGNWCVQNDSVAPLFDHNVSFGGEQSPIDIDAFMVGLTSPLDTGIDYHQQHDKILALLFRLDAYKVERFLTLLHKLEGIDIPILAELYPKQYTTIKKLLQTRIRYMSQRVGELRGR